MAGKLRKGRDTAVPSGNLVDAWKALCAAVMGNEDAVEPGFYTAAEWAEKIGKSRPRASSLLLRGIRAGKVEQRNFRITTGQVTRPIPHYKVIG